VAFVLLIVATAIGGGCGYRFFRTRDKATKATPPGVGMKGRKLGGGTLLGSARTVGRRTAGKRGFGRRSDTDDDVDEPIAVRSGRFPGSGASDGSGTSGSGLAQPERRRPRTTDNDDPEATGVDWFEDSSTSLSPVDLGEHADKT
jgi:hypothetical protein